MVQAAQEDLKTIATDLYESEKRLNELYEQQTAALEANQEAYQKSVELGVGDGREEEVNKTYKQVEALNKEIDKEIELQEKLNSEYEYTTNYINEYNGQMKKTTDEINNQVASVVNWHGHAVPLTQEVVAQIDELSQAYIDARAEALDSINKQIGLFEELSNKSDLTVGQMKSNLESQTEVMNTYREDMLTAMQLVEDGLMDEGLLGSIKEMGIDGAGYLHELVEASKTDMDQFNEVMKAFADQEEAKNELADMLAEMETNFTESKDNIINASMEMKDGLDSTMKSMADSVIDNSVNIFKNIINVSGDAVSSAKDTFGIDAEGNSREGADIGTSFVESMASSVIASGASLLDAVDSVTQQAVARARERVTDINRELGDLAT